VGGPGFLCTRMRGVTEDGSTAREDPSIVELAAVVRRFAAARLRDTHDVEDLVQEAVVRVMAARNRLDPDVLIPYALVTAQNLLRAKWRHGDVASRHAHRLVDLQQPAAPDDEAVQREEHQLVAAALADLPAGERDVLLAHEVDGVDTGTLAGQRGTTAGAVAAQLNRARTRLRVEYVIRAGRREPPTAQCRPVLFALAGGDRRRQSNVDAGRHLLECEYCGQVSEPLLDRIARRTPDELRVTVARDADVVTARQRARELAAHARFSETELTVIATAVSEVARNIVRFALRGEIIVCVTRDDGAEGVTVLARDVGPGIDDVDQALTDGYTTYGGLGLGLGGCRRLMDEFEIFSEPGRGTTVRMTKWCRR
jgi:RNA polymerase sigma factor (sigma-70 family)